MYVAAEASDAAATRVIATITHACEPLCRFPLAGAAREHFGPGLRVGFARNYALYYLHDDRELILVRVLHGARDAAALAAHGGFMDERP